jgi:hypothetical protein
VFISRGGTVKDWGQGNLPPLSHPLPLAGGGFLSAHLLADAPHAGHAEMFVLAAHLSLLLNLKRNGGGEKNERQVNDLFGG